MYILFTYRINSDDCSWQILDLQPENICYLNTVKTACKYGHLLNSRKCINKYREKNVAKIISFSSLLPVLKHKG